jgi:hypothetical protein
MAAPYTASQPGAGQGGWGGEMRSVTPAVNNTRMSGRYASAPRFSNEGAPVEDPNQTYQTVRSMTPTRYGYTGQEGGGGGFGSTAAAAAASTDEPRTPSSTGLIRLSLKKPMGIVFEPMYDPNKPSVQRGVRICDLPRTGAAALSRKLQVGDELLQINDTVVSRLTFDEIMDFIIEADPESVNLLFRRPRKETLQARQGVQQKLKEAANKDNPNTQVKWVDEEHKKSSSRKDKKKDKKEKKRPKKKEPVSEEEETLQSSTAGEESYQQTKRSRKKSRSKRNPYESESFLDMLIDTICSESNNMCRDTFRRGEDDYISDEDESFGTMEDEQTLSTYESDVRGKGPRNNNKVSDDDDEEEETFEESLEVERGRRHHHHHQHKSSSKHHNSKDKSSSKEEKSSDKKKKYEDDGTLETVETADRSKEEAPAPTPIPLGLSPNPVPPVHGAIRPQLTDTDDEVAAAPIKELEYDDRIDHGADVSVMESLGGPSLLIEKQRAAAAAQKRAQVPAEIVDKFGLDYPAAPGMTRQQTIESDPLKFYTYVVKQLLEEHEPEKVRLLDKLLAKYKGREDHLVQKLSVRYHRAHEDIPEEEPETFADTVKKNKASQQAENAVTQTMQRMAAAAEQDPPTWPDKETKEPDEGDEESESGSDYSRESVDGTSPAVIAQVSELLNYVYGKTSVPGQIDRVSTIMRAYEGREAVLLELLETKALIKANKEKENADNLPSFLRNTQLQQPQQAQDEGLPPVTPMATQPGHGTVINDDISSMSGVSSPAGGAVAVPGDSVMHEGIEAPHLPESHKEPSPMKEVPKTNASASSRAAAGGKPPATPDKRKKKGLFGGLFGGKKNKNGEVTRTASRLRNGRKLKGVKSVEGSI